MTEIQLRAGVCEVGKWLWQRGLVGASEGNISLRLDSNRLLCTPAGTNKGNLQPDDLVIVDVNGKTLGRGKPSSELKLHLRIYQKRPDCQAIVHAHPPFATGFALAGETLADNLMPEAAYVLGSVALVPFGMPGTEEVPDSIEPYLDAHKTFLLSHHGAVVLGLDLWDAYNRMETLERIAKIVLIANLLRGAQPMPKAAFDSIADFALTGKL